MDQNDVSARLQPLRAGANNGIDIMTGYLLSSPVFHVFFRTFSNSFSKMFQNLHVFPSSERFHTPQ